ncbi:MAG: adenosine deaminase [Bacteroidota bacterium]
MTEFQLFDKALVENDLPLLKSIEKSDLHNHSGLGFKFEKLKIKYGETIISPPTQMDSIEEMTNYIAQILRPYYKTIDGYNFAIKSAFEEAENDGVKVLKMSIDCWFTHLFDCNGSKFAKFIETIQKAIAPELTFLPEIGMSRNVPARELEKIVLPLIDTGYFKSIDLYGDENIGNIKDFKSIYKYASKNKLELTAHAGEFRNANFVRETIDILEVSSIQHGINAAQSKEVIRFLIDNKIQLNICPSSNLHLKRVNNIKQHPIKLLFDEGVLVTINSDDILFFNNTVSDEYLLLYNNNVFSAKELNQIRMNGLKYANGK